MKKIFSTVYLIFFLGIAAASAQTLKSLSEEPTTFLEEFISMMSDRINEENQLILDEFVSYFQSGAFNEEEKLHIINISNLLLDRRARPYPHFRNYIRALSSFRKGALPQEDYYAWEKGFIDLLEDKRYSINKINTFLEISHLTITENTLYISSSLKWKSSSSDMKMVYNDALSFVFSNTNLTCHSQRDSIVIYQTTGIYDPATYSWSGKNGTVDWQRAGFKESEVYAKLTSYQIDFTKSRYKADSTLFTHPNYFPDGELGLLTDRVKVTRRPEQASFPVFESYKKRLTIKGIYPDIDFEGGLLISGATMKGTGNEAEPANLKYYKNDTLKMLVNSSTFQIKGNRISSHQAAISLYLENDSIFHPNIGFAYRMQFREVSLFRTDDPLTSAPYFDSYHMVDMSFEQLVWKLDEPIVRLTLSRGSALGEARFKSASYFNENHFFKMQAMDDLHPLFLLRKFSEWYYADEFPVSDLADWMGKPLYQIQLLVTRMAIDGFVFFKAETGMVKIKQQLLDYLAASGKNIDYDVIDFVSTVRAPGDNATLNLINNELTINGIPRVFISDSQNVDIVPAKNQIILKKNRNFNFGGRVQAGLLTFYGENFTFEYDSFKINLHNIDSLNMAILSEEADEFGYRKPVKIKNNIENITGELFIDHPYNKSGLENFEEYPSFESTATSFVFYEITEGMDSTIYEKEQFHYKLNPFVINDLTNLEREDLNFDGEFYAGNIFPVLHQDLAVQEDLSLGFKVATAPEGMSVYGGLATYYDEIILSNKGIEGKGKLIYLSSTTYSENFSFYPDSMLIEASQFIVEKDSIDPKFPYISAHELNIKWYPNEDEWFTYKKEENLDIFSENISFSGNLLMKSTGLTGTGTLYIEDAEIYSNNILYSDISFHADSSNLKVRSEDQKGYSIVANQVSSNVNIQEGDGIFNSLNDTIPLLFPEKNYMSAVDLIMWDMTENKLNMINQDPRNDAYKFGAYANENQWEKPPTFMSLNPRSDSLAFTSDSAVYKLDDHTITAYYVDFLEIADAHIFPGDNSLTLERTGFMKGFTNAKIIANGSHEIIAEEINILSRKKYYGSGFYNYIDKDKIVQRIRLGDVTVNKKGFTYAEGEISQIDSLMLSPHFWFDGKVSLDAENEFLEFSGGVRLSHNCDSIARNRIQFTSMIDPENIRIPIAEKSRTPDGSALYKGIFVTNMTSEVYAAFFSKRKSYSDTPISTAHGFLMFDEKSRKYKLASEEKLADHSIPGNLLTLERNYCRTYGEGSLNLAVEMNQLKLTAVGNITNDIEQNLSSLQLLLGLDFFFSQEALQITLEDINSKPSLNPVDMSENVYTHGVNELLGISDAQAMSDESMLFGALGNLPEKLVHTLMFTKLNLTWNDQLSSYISEGQIGIGNINGIPVNRMVEGFIEIQKKRSGDILDVYLQIDERTWYYFGYTRGVMQAYSNNRDFLDILTGLNNNQRTMKVKSGEISYIYMVASDRKISNFRRRMTMIQEGDQFIEEERLEDIR